ncbi:MAG: hypothetical protein ACPG5T_03170 [Endozoicomonas sp.]
MSGTSGAQSGRFLKRWLKQSMVAGKKLRYCSGRLAMKILPG